jgi:hypothetical protein
VRANEISPAPPCCSIILTASSLSWLRTIAATRFEDAVSRIFSRVEILRCSGSPFDIALRCPEDDVHGPATKRSGFENAVRGKTQQVAGTGCLPLAGVVYLQSLLVAGEYVYPDEHLRGYAEQLTSTRFHYAVLLELLQVTLLLAGSIALYSGVASLNPSVYLGGCGWIAWSMCQQPAGVML